jgi:hypothetical protein
MSADDGIYILQTLGPEFRVVHTQAIENIYWHPTCCDNPDIGEYKDSGPDEEYCYHEICKNCNTKDPKRYLREEAYLPTLYDYFHESEVFSTKEEAFEQADFLYFQANKDCCCGVEYGIQVINGLEDIQFPTKGEE